MQTTKQIAIAALVLSALLWMGLVGLADEGREFPAKCAHSKSARLGPEERV